MQHDTVSGKKNNKAGHWTAVCVNLNSHFQFNHYKTYTNI